MRVVCENVQKERMTEFSTIFPSRISPAVVTPKIVACGSNSTRVVVRSLKPCSSLRPSKNCTRRDFSSEKASCAICFFSDGKSSNLTFETLKKLSSSLISKCLLLYHFELQNFKSHYTLFLPSTPSCAIIFSLTKKAK